MAPREYSHHTVREIGETLSGGVLLDVLPARLGGNNRIFQLIGENQSFALKFYPAQEEDPRDRLGNEYVFLDFLSGCGIKHVPEPIIRDDTNSCALYSWVEGEPVDDATDEDIEALAWFLIGLQPLKRKPEAKRLNPASAACPAPDDAFKQLHQRFERLKDAGGEHPGLRRFLENDFKPKVALVTEQAQAALKAGGINSERPLTADKLAISPSDFGFHNALRNEGGGLNFLDFEYAGWDDPVKAVADAMLHPGGGMNDTQAEHFRAKMFPVFATDPKFEERFTALYPVYALIWCLIILNEFLPERWTRRRLAGQEADLATIQNGQLEKATTLLRRIAHAA